MSSAESRPTPDHKIQLSHTAGVVRPALNPKKGRISTSASALCERVRLTLAGRDQLAQIPVYQRSPGV